MRQWSAEDRQRAITLAQEVGKAEAARQLGMPAGTIASWLHRAGIGVAPEMTERMALATAVRQVTMAERKAALAERLAELAHKATAQLAAKIDADEVNARDLVAALTAAVDRLQLLTGEATQRTEATVSGEPARERLLAAVSTLAERRVA